MNPKPSIWCPGYRKGHPLIAGRRFVLWPFWVAGLALTNVGDPGYDLDFPGGANNPTWADSLFGPALSFNDAASQYAERDAAPVTAPPFTLAALAQSNANWIDQAVVSIAKSTDGVHFWWLGFSNDGPPFAEFRAWDGVGIGAAQSTARITLNTWAHLCGIEYAADSRAVFLNGGNKGTNATSRTPAGVNRVSIGRIGDLSPSLYLSGRVGFALIVAGAWTDEQVKENHEDPWGIITQRRRSYFYGAVMAGAAAGGPFPHYTRRRMAGGTISMQGAA